MNFVSIYGNEVQQARLAELHRGTRVPQTMLFIGPSGVGKKHIAKQFLAAIHCSGENVPCMRCASCRQMDAGTHPDYFEIGPNERGNIPLGSEEKKEPGSVRWLIHKMAMKSVYGSSAAVIDGVDMMSNEGQNAILKTIEEPKRGDHIILIASRKAGVLPTILSRCFELSFGPISDDVMKALLREKGFSDDDADMLGSISGGSVETALLLSDESIREELFAQCRVVDTFLGGGSGLPLDLSPLEKKLGKDKLLGILIHIYRLNLVSLLRGTKNDENYSRWMPVFVDDEQKVQSLIKVLLKVRNDAARNISIKTALKGMLYHADFITGKSV